MGGERAGAAGAGAGGARAGAAAAAARATRSAERRACEERRQLGLLVGTILSKENLETYTDWLVELRDYVYSHGSLCGELMEHHLTCQGMRWCAGHPR